MVATNSAVLLAKVETTFRTDPTPTPGSNALIITDPPTFEPDVQKIDRNVARASFSKVPSRNGRITANYGFVHEVMGSGVAGSGTLPPQDALLRACGMARTAISTGGLVRYWKRPGTKGNITFVDGSSTYTPDYVRYFTLTCTTLGVSGTCQFTITSPALTLPNGTTLTAISVAAAAITSATPITLGSGAIITPTITGSQSVGDSYVIMCGPPGNLYTPVSTGFESITMYLYYEGIVHKTNGARGSWSMEASAGNIGKFTFKFQGDWVDPTDASLPTGVVVTDVVPPVTEFAQAFIDGNLASCPVNFKVDLANALSIRECANAAQGYAGAAITGRAPVVSFDPDFAPEATYPFWGRFKNATEVDFSFTIGTTIGNMCHVSSHIQYTKNGYGDRTGQRIYQIDAAAVSRAGDDEISLYFH